MKKITCGIVASLLVSISGYLSFAEAKTQPSQPYPIQQVDVRTIFPISFDVVSREVTVDITIKNSTTDEISDISLASDLLAKVSSSSEIGVASGLTLGSTTTTKVINTVSSSNKFNLLPGEMVHQLLVRPLLNSETNADSSLRIFAVTNKGNLLGSQTFALPPSVNAKAAVTIKTGSMVLMDSSGRALTAGMRIQSSTPPVLSITVVNKSLTPLDLVAVAQIKRFNTYSNQSLAIESSGKTIHLDPSQELAILLPTAATLSPGNYSVTASFTHPSDKIELLRSIAQPFVVAGQGATIEKRADSATNTFPNKPLVATRILLGFSDIKAGEWSGTLKYRVEDAQTRSPN